MTEQELRNRRIVGLVIIMLVAVLTILLYQLDPLNLNMSLEHLTIFLVAYLIIGFIWVQVFKVPKIANHK
jgi:hypothetical protein